MKEKQQTLEIKATDQTNSLPFENELNSFIQKAKDHGCSKSRAINYLKNYWNNVVCIPELPNENEKEIIFREKAKKFMEMNYEEFDAFSYKNYYFPYSGGWSWTLMDKLDTLTKRNFIYEVACNMYKGFEMEVFDRRELTKINTERTKILFPDIKDHSKLFALVLSKLFGFIENYKVEEECNKFLEQFELTNSYDSLICKFVWMVENFQP